MSTTAQTEARAALAMQMRAEGRSYDEIAKELGLRSRSHVNYYMNLEKRRKQCRENYGKNGKANRSRSNASYGGTDRSAFRPESPRQSAMWAKLLSEARP